MSFIKNWLCCIPLVLFARFSNAQPYMAGGREHLPPKPVQVAGVANPIKNLDGHWEINLTPATNATADYSSSAQWRTIQVPGEAMMQGFKIKHDAAFTYRKKLPVITNTTGKKHVIRFNGVFNHAKVYCNGNLVREHFGGFTAWDADITKFVKPGQDNWLHVSVTDRADDISYASGYAHHPIGGITRKVQYIILPDNPVTYIYAKAGLTNNYMDGTLRIEASLLQPAKVTIEYELADASGKKVWNTARSLKPHGNTWLDSTTIPGVKTWTAESPGLYKLTLRVKQNGQLQQTIVQQLGFRSVEINKDNEMLVNGKTVKLRGACRHDMHPTLGRSTNRTQDSLDVVLTKEANMNFIRTSHYPPSEDFLEFCDRYGVYVQEETAICFVLNWRTEPYIKYYQTMDNPAFTDRYLGQLSEMIDRDRNHAAVVMWSIGNESWYGTNFQKEYEFVKSVDSGRPVSWSFPTTALDKGKRNFDILVSHYPAWNGSHSDLGKYEKNMKADLPIIGDEWAHVTCYNTDLSFYDPNVKDFWGKSLDSIWSYRFDVKGYLGGAIWGMIDETFEMKDTTVGYGPWGIVDTWRRKKAEFWNTKKAYSPVRLLLQEISNNNGLITIPVHNRFDHTNLKNIQAVIVTGNQKKALSLPDVAPHAMGKITLPATAADSTVLVQFKDNNGTLIDEELISWKMAPVQPSAQNKGVWTIENKEDQTLLKSGDLVVSIDTKTGAINRATVAGQHVITGNPLLVVNRPLNAGVLKNTDGIFSGAYQSNSFSFDQNNKAVFIITSKGKVDNYPVEMTTTLYPGGQITITYSADSIPAHTWDIGVGIPVAASFNKISWNRKGYWSTYPKGHLSALTGSAAKTANSKEVYGVRPGFEVAQSMRDFILTKGKEELYRVDLPSTEIYRAKKENIYRYTVSGNKGAVHVFSDGKQAAKMNVQKDGSQQLLVSDKWDYWTLSWGNYQGTRNRSKKMSGTVLLQLQ